MHTFLPSQEVSKPRRYVKEESIYTYSVCFRDLLLSISHVGLYLKTELAEAKRSPRVQGGEKNKLWIKQIWKTKNVKSKSKSWVWNEESGIVTGGI